jgi:methylglutaconyl-CoA hydratase
MATRLIETRVDSHIARIQLNRADRRNALSRQMLEELREAIRVLRGETTVRLVILGADGPVFCAGMDLGEMLDRADDPEAEEMWRLDTEIYAEVLTELLTWPVPTIALLPGPALAGGMGLALACDFVLADENAWFSLPEPRRGITAAVVTPFLIHRLGVGRATPILLGGRNLSAGEARAVGLVHAVTTPATADEILADWRGTILSGGPEALARTKRVLLETAGTDLSAQLEFAREESAAARATDEAREGLNAFREKRPPAWAPE